MSSRTTLVTGGAGFIGSHVVDRLVDQGVPVVVVDNFSNSSRRWLTGHEQDGAITVRELDVLDTDGLSGVMAGHDVGRVIHLAASVDLRIGLEDTFIDIEQSVHGTRSVLEAMRRSGVRSLVFSSSSTVYGDVSRRPTAEDYGPMLPISLYGAAKLAAEGLVSTYSALYGIRAAIFRFGNVVGGRMSHGVIHDFLNKLAEGTGQLEVLGDGRQRKNYFLVEDCARGITTLAPADGDAVLVANLGADDTVEVARIAEIVMAEAGSQAQPVYGTERSGWPGDVPVVEFDLGKAHSLGWYASTGSEAAVREAARRLVRERAAV